MNESAMERIAALEVKVEVLEKAMERAFGRRWLDLLVKNVPVVKDKREPE